MKAAAQEATRRLGNVRFPTFYFPSPSENLLHLPLISVSSSAHTDTSEHSSAGLWTCVWTGGSFLGQFGRRCPLANLSFYVTLKANCSFLFISIKHICIKQTWSAWSSWWLSDFPWSDLFFTNNHWHVKISLSLSFIWLLHRQLRSNSRDQVLKCSRCWQHG